MKKKLYKKLPARLDYLSKFIQSISGFAKEQGFSEKRIGEIELIAEEALVNIFSYAYPDKDGDVEINCTAGTGDSIKIKIVDSGVSFDMLSLSDPDVNADIEDRPIGGLGIFLIRKFVNEVKYRRENGKNILILKISKD